MQVFTYADLNVLSSAFFLLIPMQYSAKFIASVPENREQTLNTVKVFSSARLTIPK